MSFGLAGPRRVADWSTLRIHDLPPQRARRGGKPTCPARSAESNPPSLRWAGWRPGAMWPGTRTVNLTDVEELLDRAARENMRSSDVSIRHADAAGIAFGWSGGLRLAVTTWSQRHHHGRGAPHCADRVPARSKRLESSSTTTDAACRAGRTPAVPRAVLARQYRGPRADPVWDLRWSPAGRPARRSDRVVGQPAGWSWCATLRIAQRPTFVICSASLGDIVRVEFAEDAEQIRKSGCGPAAAAPAASPAATGP